MQQFILEQYQYNQIEISIPMDMIDCDIANQNNPKKPQESIKVS